MKNRLFLLLVLFCADVHAQKSKTNQNLILNWFQQKPNGDFYNRNILRFTVFHKINLKKNKKQDNRQ